MAKIQPFELDSNNVIVVPVLINDIEYVNMILDTGASHTVINFKRLIDLGYKLSDTQGLTVTYTANGAIEENTFLIKSILFSGITKKNLNVTAYSFESSEYGADGVLGLDFFEDLILKIDFKKNTIELKK